MSACICERYRIVAPDGEILEGETRRDPDCRQHGFPDDRWPAGHPLARHAMMVDRDSGELLTDEAVRLLTYRQRRRLRVETPRETEQRLYQEAVGCASDSAGQKG